MNTTEKFCIAEAIQQIMAEVIQDDWEDQYILNEKGASTKELMIRIGKRILEEYK